MDDTIVVIDKIEEAEDDKGKRYLKITDKAGVTRNFKEGRSKLLTNKGHLLEEGKAIKIHFEDYTTPAGKVFPFVRDFESVTDEFVRQATEKVQVSSRHAEEEGYNMRAAFKGIIELIIAKELEIGSKQGKEALEWASSNLHSVAQIVATIEEAKGETDQGSQEVKLTNGQDSGETIKTAGELLTWIVLKDKSIKAPRLWLNTNFKVDDKEVLTDKKCQELFETIKKDKGW